MTADPFELYDAAYVLGALTAEDRRAYERHLQDCPDCSQAVAEVAGLPGLLATAEPEVLQEPAPQVPGSVLEGLLARRRRERLRRRWWVTGVAVATAAAVAVVALVVLPRSGSDPVQTVAFTQVVPSPIHARADLYEEEWGTRIELDCRYEKARGGESVSYGLVVTGRGGRRENIGTWWVGPGESISMTASTDIPAADIARVDIVGPKGTKLLRASP